MCTQTHADYALQARMLHIYDPKALHSVYIKDQDSYYRGEKSIGYV